MTPPTTHTLGTLDVPRSLIWVDEFGWSATVRAHETSITGALIVDQAVLQAGRPITLQGVDDHGWVARGALQTLWQLASTSTDPLPLALADGRTFSVRFAPGQPIEATAVARAELPGADMPYVVTLRLVTA